MNLFLFLFSLLWGVQAGAMESINHEFSESSSRKIEFFVAQPEGPGPYPALIFIHPHQEWPYKIGARAFLKNGELNYWAKKGFVSVAISQPGYGESSGPADFCGPTSQDALLQIAEKIRQRKNVDRKSIFVYGGSRGAVVAALAASRNREFAGLILKSGLYDLPDAYQNYPWYHSIKLSILWELGWNNATALEERSLLRVAAQVKTPTLIIHGNADDRANLEYAKQFLTKINSSGGNARLITLESEHVIPMEKIHPQMETFIEEIRRTQK